MRTTETPHEAFAGQTANSNTKPIKITFAQLIFVCFWRKVLPANKLLENGVSRFGEYTTNGMRQLVIW
jgi:hypothetical protein